jgi:hypothetical protein
MDMEDVRFMTQEGLAGVQGFLEGQVGMTREGNGEHRGRRGG